MLAGHLNKSGRVVYLFVGEHLSVSLRKWLEDSFDSEKVSVHVWSGDKKSGFFPELGIDDDRGFPFF